MKLFVRIREGIKIVYITIIFVSVLVSFVIPAILTHVTWALAQEWVLSNRTAQTVTWALTREWALARDTTVEPTRKITGYAPAAIGLMEKNNIQDKHF